MRWQEMKMRPDLQTSNVPHKPGLNRDVVRERGGLMASSLRIEPAPWEDAGPGFVSPHLQGP